MTQLSVYHRQLLLQVDKKVSIVRHKLLALNWYEDSRRNLEDCLLMIDQVVRESSTETNNETMENKNGIDSR